MSDDGDFYPIGLVGLCLYSVLLFFTTCTFVWTLFKTKPCLSLGVPRLVLMFLLAFLIVRLVWLSFKTFDDASGTTFVLSRAAFCFYFTSFSMVVFNWADVYHSNYIQSTSEAHQKFLPTVKWVFLLVNAGIYLFQVVVIVLYYVSDQKKEGDPVYEANIIVDVSASFLVSVLFLLYGVRLFVIRRPEVSSLWGGMYDVWKVLAITVIFTLCFMLRVVLFLYRPIVGEFLNIVVFNLLGYYLPESIPVLLQVYLIQTSKRKAIEENEFIESLYREGSSDLDDETVHINQTKILYFPANNNNHHHHDNNRSLAIDVHTETSDALFHTPTPRITSRS